MKIIKFIESDIQWNIKSFRSAWSIKHFKVVTEIHI